MTHLLDDFSIAVSSQDDLKAILLVEKMKRENLLDNIPRDYIGAHPLHLCVLHNNYTLLEVLFTAGLNINSLDRHKKHCLQQVIYYGNVEMAEFLFKNGADLGSIPKPPVSYIVKPLKDNNYDLLKCLLKHGLVLNQETLSGQTVYDLMKWTTDPRIIHLLGGSIAC